MTDPLYVLIVEDDATNRMLATRILTASGFLYAEATDGEHALELLKGPRPDLVLMDLSLPGIDGWELTRRIRQNAALSSLPVLAVSAHAMHGDRDRAIAAGCDDYLTKPYRPSELIAAISRLTSLSAPVDRLLATKPATSLSTSGSELPR
jgi:two-component system cell cycle response regulator DivK